MDIREERRQFLSFLIFFAISAVCTFVLYFFLKEVRAFCQMELLFVDKFYLFTPPPMPFDMVPAFFLGMVAVAYVTARLYTLALKTEAPKFFEMQRKMGRARWHIGDNRKLPLGIVSICLLFWGLCFNYYTHFTENALVFSGLFSLKSHEIHYNEIEEIRVYSRVKGPNGNIIQRIVFELLDKEKIRFTSYDALIPENVRIYEEIINSISEKSAVTPKYAGTYNQRLSDIGGG